MAGAAFEPPQFLNASTRPGTKRDLVLDILFVLILPPLCFAFDPIIFARDFVTGRTNFAEPSQMATYVGVGCFISSFFLTYLPSKSVLVRTFLSGAILAGAFSAFLAGIFLLPLTLIGLIFVIGLLGFIPFGTAWRYWRRYNTVCTPSDVPALALVIAILGFAAPFAPSALVLNYGQAKQGEILASLQSSDLAEIRTAISAINGSLFCRDFCQSSIVDLFVAGKVRLPEQEFAMLFQSATGKDYKSLIVDPNAD